MPNGCSYFTTHFFQCHQNTIILSQCSIVLITLSSYGLFPLTPSQVTATQTQALMRKKPKKQSPVFMIPKPQCQGTL